MGAFPLIHYGIQTVCRILSLDGGGAKGFSTLGVLNRIEALLGKEPLCERFDQIFGTSTGAIIAALLGLGKSVAETHTLYKSHVPHLMALRGACARTAALERLAQDVFKDAKFENMKTGVGIGAARWIGVLPGVGATQRLLMAVGKFRASVVSRLLVYYRRHQNCRFIFAINVTR